jgi:hypothetical protein
VARSFAPIVIASAVLVSCSSGFKDGDEYNCTPDPSPTLQIDTSSFQSGTVVTRGACTQVHCGATVGSGCRLWQGDMTSKDPSDRCEVFLSLDDGRTLSRLVGATPKCGAPQLKSATFSP